MGGTDELPLSESSDIIETPPPDEDRGTEDHSSKSYRSSISGLSNMSEAVTLLIGPDRKAFVVHKALLVNTCDYFKKATSGEWIESRSNVHTLDDVNVQVFEMFMRWLYSGVLRCLDLEDLDQLLVQAWALGDRLQSCRLKNVVMTALAKDWNRYRDGYPLSMTVALMAYDLSPPNAKIRQLTKRKFSLHAGDGRQVDSASTINHDLLVDLCNEMSNVIGKVRGGGRKAVGIKHEIARDVCSTYHEHPDGHRCTATQMEASYQFHDSDEGLCSKIYPFAKLEQDVVVEPGDSDAEK